VSLFTFVNGIGRNGGGGRGERGRYARIHRGRCGGNGGHSRRGGYARAFRGRCGGDGGHGRRGGYAHAFRGRCGGADREDVRHVPIDQETFTSSGGCINRGKGYCSRTLAPMQVGVRAIHDEILSADGKRGNVKDVTYVCVGQCNFVFDGVGFNQGVKVIRLRTLAPLRTSMRRALVQNVVN